LGAKESVTAKVIPLSARPSLEQILATAKSTKNGKKFTKLWQRGWASDYPSQSEADLALASMLAFYTGPDEELLDEVLRQSGLYRDKWQDRDDYRESVSAKALDRDDFYSWGVPSTIEELAKEIVAKGSTPKSLPAKKEKPTQTQRLIEIAETGELWRTPDQVAFAAVRAGDDQENMPVNSTAYRRWLVNRFYKELGNTVGEKINGRINRFSALLDPSFA